MSGFVYFVQRGASGPIKIGYAVKVGRRVDQLQTACAEPLRVLATLPAVPMMERELHRKFADLAIGGEWFRPAPPIFQFLAQRIANASIRSEREPEQLRLVAPPAPPKPPQRRETPEERDALAKAAEKARAALQAMRAQLPRRYDEPTPIRTREELEQRERDRDQRIRDMLDASRARGDR